MSETFTAFLTTDPGTTALPLPVLSTDRVAVVRDKTYYASALYASRPSYSYQQPPNAATLVASTGLGEFVIDPLAELASLTVVLPAAPVDGDVFYLTVSQTIDALTVTAAAGQSISAAKAGPVAFGAGGTLRFKYVAGITTWF